MEVVQMMLWKPTDWEAMADRIPFEFLSQQCLPEVSELSLEDKKVQNPKHRGRATFSYRKQGLHSDQQSDMPDINTTENEAVSHLSEGVAEIRDSLEACNHIQRSFTARVLDDNDLILSLISSRDLEPPCQMPQTSARTAQRLITQGMTKYEG